MSLQHLTRTRRHGLGVEARMRERQPEQAERLLGVRRQRRQATRSWKSRPGSTLKPDRAIGERRLERGAVEIASALVQQRRGEGGKPRLGGGIVSRAGGQRSDERDHRDGVILGEPDLRAVDGIQGLDGGGRGGAGDYLGKHPSCWIWPKVRSFFSSRASCFKTPPRCGASSPSAIALTLAIFLVATKLLGFGVPFAGVIAGFIGGAAQPALFRNLKFR